MKLLHKISTLLVLTTCSFASLAADYGVELEWNTDNAQEVIDAMAQQRAEFSKLIEAGEIKDMYIAKSKIGDKPARILRFVIEAESEQEVTDKLSDLPLYKKNLVKISNIRHLGAKWLDNTPITQNYGITLTWYQDVDSLEMDRVLGIDLSRVISLNQAGSVTSAYLDTQTLSNGDVRPVYLISVLATDAKQASELSKQFEAVNLGYARAEIQYLGQKLNMKGLN